MGAQLIVPAAFHFKRKSRDSTFRKYQWTPWDGQAHFTANSLLLTDLSKFAPIGA